MIVIPLFDRNEYLDAPIFFYLPFLFITYLRFKFCLAITNAQKFYQISTSKISKFIAFEN